MKSVTDVYNSIWTQQKQMLNEIHRIIYSSGNMKGIPQWRDRKRFYQLDNKFAAGDYLLSKKDFQFLESLYFKYKV